jgi:hypothetical protein
MSKTLDRLYASPAPAMPEPDDLGAAAPGDDGAWLAVAGKISAQLGVVASELRAARQRAERNAGNLFYSPIQPLVLTSAAASGGVTTFSSSELWGPKTGFFWAIQRMAAFGLAAAGSGLVTSQGTATSPTTFQTLGTVSGLTPGGSYQVTAVTVTSGTTGTPEVNNFRLAQAPLPSILLNSEPGQTLSNTVTATATPTGTLLVTTGSNTPTTGAVYGYTLDIVAAGDELNLYRGQPAPQNFMNNLEFTAPEWRPGHTGMILQPGDFITAQAAGLVGSPVAVNFDAIIGRLDLLPDYLS